MTTLQLTKPQPPMAKEQPGFWDYNLGRWMMNKVEYLVENSERLTKEYGMKTTLAVHSTASKLDVISEKGAGISIAGTDRDFESMSRSIEGITFITIDRAFDLYFKNRELAG